MRNLVAAALLFALIAPVPALSQTTGPTAEAGPRIEQLYADLKRERNEHAAQRIADRIKAEWAKSGSATIDLLMGWSADAVRAKKYGVALDFLDQVTVLDPGYAEGWNRRATVHFLMENYAKSMADIDKALAIEPRHFGALAGMAAIFKLYGDDKTALEIYRRILAVYPMMRDAQDELVKLTDEIGGQDI